MWCLRRHVDLQQQGRAHAQDAEEGHDSKRARIGTTKKQRVERIAAEHELSVSAVKISENEVVHTMDDYEHDLQRSAQDELDLFGRTKLLL